MFHSSNNYVTKLLDILELLSSYHHNKTHICLLAQSLIYVNECWIHCLHLPQKTFLEDYELKVQRYKKQEAVSGVLLCQFQMGEQNDKCKSTNY